MRRAVLLILLVSLSLLAAPAAFAEPPANFTHQGRIIHNEVPFNGEMDIQFDFFKAGDPTPILTERVQQVSVVDGFYTVHLGSQTAGFINIFSSEQPVDLRVTIFPEDFKTDGLILDPMQRITSVPYAVVARGVSGGPVSATSITVGGRSVVDESGAWSGPAITSSKIEDESITSVKIRDEAVTSSDIQDNTVTSDDLADGSVHSAIIMDNSVSSADIQDNSVTSNDIQNNTIKQTDVQRGGGIYAFKSDVYTTRITFSATSGGVSTQDVSCEDANDLPLSGTCTAPASSSAQLWSTDALNWSDETRPASWRCAFSNEGASVDVEAQILCVRVP